MTNRRYKKYSYRLETLAPIHIGTGAALSPLEYHISDKSGLLIVPDVSKLFAKYPDEARHFSQQLAAKSQEELVKTSLSDLLGSTNPLEDASTWAYALKTLHGREVQLDALKKLRREVTQGQGEVKAAMKTPEFCPYLPGSSIKGALKTAWAYAQCLNDPRIIRTLFAKSKPQDERDTIVSRREKRSHQALQAKVFQSQGQDDAAYDLFRALSVGDTTPRHAKDSLLLVAERVLSSAISARDDLSQEAEAEEAEAFEARYKSYWVFCETINAGTAFTGRMTFDHGLLNQPFAQRVMNWSDEQRGLNMETLNTAVNRFATDSINWEILYFESIKQAGHQCDVDRVLDFYDNLDKQISDASPDTFFFSLGHGSGWHKLTIGTLLETRLSKSEFADLRRNLKLAPDRIAHEYPKSRKLIMTGETQAYSPFGWVKMMVDSSEA